MAQDDVTFRKAIPADHADLMRMLDQSFRHGEGRFIELLPNLYRDPAIATGGAYLACDGSKMVGHVGVYPLHLRLMGGQELRAGGIGAVATEHAYRGRGVMGRLLENAAEGMREAGCDVSVLWGDRQRYRRYGWETVGQRFEWRFEERVAIADGIPAVRLQPYAERYLEAVLAAWNSDTLGTLQTRASLVGILQRKKFETWVTENDGRFAFAILQRSEPGTFIHKMVGTAGDKAGMLLALGHIETRPNASLVVCCPPVPHPVAALGLKYGTDFTVRPMCNLRVIRTDQFSIADSATKAFGFFDLSGSPAISTEPTVRFWIEAPATV